MPAHILVVDDERAILRALKRELAAEGWTVSTAESGEEAVQLANRYPPDMVILDLGLPGINGLDVCRAIRERSRCPILMLTAGSSERDKVRALDSGADDYVTKPFGVDELLARVRAHLRRWKDVPTAGAPITIGELEIDPWKRTVTIRGESAKLTRTEYDLLVLFAQSPGRVLTHHHILNYLGGANSDADIKALRVHIANLRKKIERRPEHPEYLLTEVGVGYRFADPFNP